MVTYRGYKTQAMYVAEASFGAGGTVTTAIEGKLQNITINKKNNLQRISGIGDGRNDQFTAWGNFEVDWSAEYELSGFDFLQFAIGTRSGSGTAVAPYYLEESDYTGYTGNAVKTFALEVSSKDLAATGNTDLLKGGIINTIGINLAVGGKVKCSLAGFAQTVVSSTTTTAYVANTTKPWIFSQGAFKWNGSAVARVTSATININNNIDPNIGREIGNRLTQEMPLGLRKYDWVITVKMTDTIATTLRDHFYGTVNSPNTGVVSAEPAFYDLIFNLSEGAASTNRNAQILLSSCAIDNISKPINIGDSLVELTINGTAKAGTTDTVNKPFKYWTVP